MAVPQTGLTSCQIGDIGYPRRVHVNFPSAVKHVALPMQLIQILVWAKMNAAH